MAEMQEPISIEELAKINISTQVAPETTSKTGSEVTAPAVWASPSLTSQGQLAPLPPGGPYEPASSEIQAALKNAGYYAGLIDGKIGPLSKKAIEEFQKANALKVDGKIGPNTWALLSKYLNSVPTPSKPIKKR